MIHQTFRHFPGIGPKTDQKLKHLGLSTWQDCLSLPDLIPFGEDKKRRFITFLEESERALETNNLEYFVTALPTCEHWRILAAYFSQATFFDIETTGLSFYDSKTTVISAFHKGRIHNFVYNENLDDFLELLEDTQLLVTFNGNSFDIPFLEHTFNIPDIGCPHIDLRWILYHQGFTGGLKRIERQMGIKRSRHIVDVDGYEAIILFHRWQNGDREAKVKLIEYCQADVISSYLSAGYLLEKLGLDVPNFRQSVAAYL